LKPPKKNKRAALPRACDFTKEFAKDWHRLERAGRFDLVRMKQAMLLLVANDGPLGPEWLDHPLKGEWAGYRECHVGGDFLLIYHLNDMAGPGGTIVFVRAGTHAELFRE
jgi:mRNA interferase YafQ